MAVHVDNGSGKVAATLCPMADEGSAPESTRAVALAHRTTPLTWQFQCPENTGTACLEVPRLSQCHAFLEKLAP